MVWALSCWSRDWGSYLQWTCSELPLQVWLTASLWQLPISSGNDSGYLYWLLTFWHLAQQQVMLVWKHWWKHWRSGVESIVTAQHNCALYMPGKLKEAVIPLTLCWPALGTTTLNAFVLFDFLYKFILGSEVSEAGYHQIKMHYFTLFLDQNSNTDRNTRVWVTRMFTHSWQAAFCH